MRLHPGNGIWELFVPGVSEGARYKYDLIARSGEPGGDSWNGLPDDRRSGGGIWVPGSYDPQTRLIYYGVGGTYLIAPLVSGATGKASSMGQPACLTSSAGAYAPSAK